MADQVTAATPPTLRELSRLTALQWSWERSFHESQRERASLHDRLLVSEQAMADAWAGAAKTERAELQAELDAIHASKAWRPASQCAGGTGCCRRAVN